MRAVRIIRTMAVVEGGLEVRIDASAESQLEALMGAIARHLDRFAFREAPLLFDWSDNCVMTVNCCPVCK